MKRLRDALRAWARLPAWARRALLLLALACVALLLWRLLESVAGALVGAAGVAKVVARLARGGASRASAAAAQAEARVAEDAARDAEFDRELRQRAGPPPDDTTAAGPGVPRSRFLRRLRR